MDDGDDDVDDASDNGDMDNDRDGEDVYGGILYLDRSESLSLSLILSGYPSVYLSMRVSCCPFILRCWRWDDDSDHDDSCDEHGLL